MNPPKESDVVYINPESGGVVWKRGLLSGSHHVRRVQRRDDILVLHAKGWSIGKGPERVYVPTQYHVFKVLHEAAGVLSLQALVSFPVVMPRLAPVVDRGLLTEVTDYPDPSAAATNGHGPTVDPDELSQGPTTQN